MEEKTTTKQEINIKAVLPKNTSIDNEKTILKENTKRFLNVRLSDVKGLNTSAMESFEKDLKNLVSKYKSKLKLDVEQFNLTKRLSERKKEVLSLLERDVKSESNRPNPNLNKVFNNYKDRLNLFDTETIASARLVIQKYSKKNRTSDF